MRRRRSSQQLGSIVLPVIGAVTLGKALLVGGAAYLVARGVGGKQTAAKKAADAQAKAANDSKDAQSATIAFATVLPAAVASATAAAAKSTPAIVPYIPKAGAAVGVLFVGLSTHDRAVIWRSGSLQSAAASLPAAPGKPAAGKPAPASGGAIAGFGDVGSDAVADAQGLANVAKWTAFAMANEIHKLALSICKNVKQVENALRSKGVKLPGEFDMWSCDQQLVFLSAIGLVMIQAIIAGALVGSLVSSAGPVVQAGLQNAADAVTAYSKQLGLKPPNVSDIANAASNAYQQGANFVSNAFGNCSVEVTRGGKR